ncbi:MAG: histidine phosphatase family protein [Chlorobiaceae bacterium]|jgi:phosphohistidine phosphatase
MKTIYLVRHAKAGSAHSGDFDRTLNKVGLKAAHFMAELLEEKSVVPDLVIASPAIRALTTAEIFCDILGYPKEQIEKRIEIYEGGAGRLLKIVQQIPDNCSTAMLFGHNPTMTAFSNLLSGGGIDSLATCGIARIDLDIKTWSDADADTGKLVWYDYPKKHQ